MSQQVVFKKKRRFRPDIAIACGILLIPISIAIYFFLPQYYSYTALGEIVSVRDVGIHGNVNFCYVREGVTHNLYERWSVRRAFPDAQFEPTDAFADDYTDYVKETGAMYRDDTIFNAIAAAEEQSGEQPSDEEFKGRLDSLIEETANYYGDSLGLMVGIGLVEELQGGDFSQGGKYVISGTGTMEVNHVVGSVGAIRDKLRTAENAGVDYFLVPKDKDSFMYEGISNEEEAVNVARELHLNLQVVPVATMEDALSFLRQLNAN